jgi:response regulator RpfG family c-di-GMP phosphodiesterase
MSQIIILCIEDEREVLDALVRDLRPYAKAFRIEAAESVAEAKRVVARMEQQGDQLALVLADHIMPHTTGVDFLIELNADPRYIATRKVLVTAQAGHHDTIRAVNEADLDHYISKPWTPADLHAVVRRQLSDYLIANVDDLLPFISSLDSPRLVEALRTRRGRAD